MKKIIHVNYLSIHSFIHPFVYPSSIQAPTHPFIQHPNHPSIQQPNYLPTHPPIHSTTQPPSHPSIQQPNHPSIQQPNHLPTHSSNNPFTHPSIHPKTQPLAHPSIQQHNCPTTQPSAHPSIHKSNPNSLLFNFLQWSLITWHCNDVISYITPLMKARTWSSNPSAILIDWREWLRRKKFRPLYIRIQHLKKQVHGYIV